MSNPCPLARAGSRARKGERCVSTSLATPIWDVRPRPAARFVVLSGSCWRRSNPDATHASYSHQVRVANRQQSLIEEVLDANSLVLTRNHIFENWTQAVGVVSGKGSYSGGYRWQLLA